MLTLHLDRMAPSSRRRAKRVGQVTGNQVKLTPDQYRHCLQTGLGDRLESLFKAIGIAALVKRWFPHCRCAARRDRLNRWSARLFKRL